METKQITLDEFEFNGKIYYCEASVGFYINIEQGDYDHPTTSEIEIEGIDIEVLQVYRPDHNDYLDCYQASVLKSVTEHITNNFEL